MTSRVDSASSMQDAGTVQKAVEEEQGDWRTQWKAYINKTSSCHTSCPPLSEPSIVSSVKDIEIVRLKEKIVSLESAQVAFDEERNEWQAKYQKKHEEVLRLAGTGSKQDRMINSLEVQLSHLHEEMKTREKKLSSMETRAKMTSEFQLRQKRKYEEIVAQLHMQLHAKDKNNASIQADLWMLTNDLRSKEQLKVEGIVEDKSTTPNSQDPLDELKTHRQQLFDFQLENTPLTELNNEAGSKAAAELVYVKGALAAAEAELEAFYATLAYNKQLEIQCDAFLVQNIELLQTQHKLLDKIKHVERLLTIYRAKSEEATNRVGELVEELELFQSSSNGSNSADEQPHELQTFFISITPIEPSPRSSKRPQTPKLKLSVVRTLSVSPRLPETLLTNPEFRQRLLDFGTSIAALSAPRLPSIKPGPQHQSSPPLHAHVTITVQPSTPSWNLLQHAQSALSRSTSSALAVKGPSGLVKRFVDEMQRLEMHHAEENRLAEQWKKVAEEHMEVARGLTVELEMERKAKKKGKEGSGAAEHCGLLDELKARGDKCEMLVGLLGEVQGRSE